jgi:hypothetical protein
MKYTGNSSCLKGSVHSEECFKDYCFSAFCHSGNDGHVAAEIRQLIVRKIR